MTESGDTLKAQNCSAGVQMNWPINHIGGKKPDLQKECLTFEILNSVQGCRNFFTWRILCDLTEPCVLRSVTDNQWTKPLDHQGGGEVQGAPPGSLCPLRIKVWLPALGQQFQAFLTTFCLWRMWNTPSVSIQNTTGWSRGNMPRVEFNKLQQWSGGK